MTKKSKPELHVSDIGRSLSTALLRRTLVITLLLGLVAAMATMWVDLQREKDAVESLARDFMSSAAPTAAAAAYNFDQAAAEQVAEGLFLERSIIEIRILNEGDVMVAEQRDVVPTLPQIGFISAPDPVVLTQSLYAPGESDSHSPIGELTITIDKTLVAPEIIDRLLTFFLVTTAKNLLFGLLLYWTIFNVLARHVSALTREIKAWQPGSAGVKFPRVPQFLQHTEVEDLGSRIEQLTELAGGALDSVQRSHDAVVDSNEELSGAVIDRTRELENANSRLRRLADHDGLTGLYNRGSFDRLLAEEFSKNPDKHGHLEVLLIDVDHFKPFNDFYGHQAGDDALVCLSSILKSVQEKTGCIMARFGGEEFVGILRSKSTNARNVADMIHAALEKEAIDHQHSTVTRRVTVSIGTVSTADDGGFKSANTLVSAADDALYEAKHAGRNRTVESSQEIRVKAKEQRLSVKAMLDAIDMQEFEPYGQPQIDARTGELVGVEALVRWVQPDGTVIPPAAFMKTAEETGLITKIDVIMLQKIGAFLLTYPDRIPRLSFNVTGESFARADFIEDILQLARSCQTGITVELLETAFIDRPDAHFLWQLDTLREAGIEIEIDDFGTGRTSILGLMAISPNRLKIARELILPLGLREGQSKLVTSVIDIAASLEMNVLAEGIETKETAQMLIDIGCPIQQGYYHGRPMPLEELLDCYTSESKISLQNYPDGGSGS